MAKRQARSGRKLDVIFLAYLMTVGRPFGKSKGSAWQCSGAMHSASWRQYGKDMTTVSTILYRVVPHLKTIKGVRGHNHWRWAEP